MEDNKFLREPSPPPDAAEAGRIDREEMEREIEELGELIEEGNKRLGLPPLSEMD